MADTCPECAEMAPLIADGTLKRYRFEMTGYFAASSMDAANDKLAEFADELHGGGAVCGWTTVEQRDDA